MIAASVNFGCERNEPNHWPHGSPLICGGLTRRATALGWGRLAGRRPAPDHRTDDPGACASCSNSLTCPRSRGFHALVAFLASAAVVTPRRRSPSRADHAGGTLACAGPVGCVPQTVGKARPTPITTEKAAVVAMR